MARISPPASRPTCRRLKLHAPFFRFPGFADTPDLRDWFAANNVGIFGVDLWASDWVAMTPERGAEADHRPAGKGRARHAAVPRQPPWTADMMPAFLRELKKRGYRVVHMVAGPGNGPTVAAPPGWISETERTIGALKPRLERPPRPGRRRGRSRSSRRRASRPAPQKQTATPGVAVELMVRSRGLEPPPRLKD